MTKPVLLLLAAYYGATAIFIFLFPHTFYEITPGVSDMGPFNLHFIRDAGLAFLAASATIGWGVKTNNPLVCLFGALWVALHGLFHIQIQLARGLPMDIVLASDVFGVIIPAALAVFLSLRFVKEIQ